MIWKYFIVFFVVFILIYFLVWIFFVFFVLGYLDILIVGIRLMLIGDLLGIFKLKSNVYVGFFGLWFCIRIEDLKFYIIMEINVSLNKIYFMVIKYLIRMCIYIGLCLVKLYLKFL